MSRDIDSNSPEVLIVGAGPTGLVLALWLAQAGIRFRIIDQALEPGTTSRALVVHARTLEFYRQLGLDGALLEAGVRFDAVNYWIRGRRRAQFRFGGIGAELSPYPDILVCPQDVHERILIDHLTRLGVEVERGVTFTGFGQNEDLLCAHLRRGGGEDEGIMPTYVAGCDGAHSVVRHALDVTFPGGTYSDVFYVADVALAASQPSRELHLALEGRDFLAIFPLRDPKTVRLVGTLQGHPQDRREKLNWDDVNHALIERMGLHVARVNWFSTYRVHHRVADRFRCGSAFLLGDAAHVHSPVGGQGMNTGIGDAVNLGWKLADVLRGRAPDTLLDTYEPERRAFALQLVATTDRAFTVATSDTAIARWVKMTVVPLVLPWLLRVRPVRRFLFRTISQTRINYRQSRLSVGRSGEVCPGDRLPWVENDPRLDRRLDNFAPLATCDWQVHVYGLPSAGVVAIARERSLPLRVFPWTRATDRAGLIRNVPYLLRPDGYIAYAGRRGNASGLAAYLDAQQLHFTSPVPSVPAAPKEPMAS